MHASTGRSEVWKRVRVKSQRVDVLLVVLGMCSDQPSGI